MSIKFLNKPKSEKQLLNHYLFFLSQIDINIDNIQTADSIYLLFNKIQEQ